MLTKYIRVVCIMEGCEGEYLGREGGFGCCCFYVVVIVVVVGGDSGEKEEEKNFEFFLRGGILGSIF